MVYRMKVFLFLCLVLFSGFYAYAGEISFSAHIDKDKLALNDYLVYSLTVTGEEASLPEPKLENIENFTVYGSGRSQNISFSNGKRSGSLTVSYTLAPKKTGKFIIPPAKIEYEKKTYSTEPVSVEVTEAARIQRTNVRSRPSPTEPEARKIDKDVRTDVFVKASLNKKKAYVNEKLIYKFGFYTNADLVSNPQYYAPDFKGFWKDVSTPKTRYESAGGINYLVNEIETVLYPIESGKITVGPSRLKIAFMDFSSRDSADDFFSLFINMGQRKEKILETEEIAVEILPLPSENKPEDFSGAVGDFKMQASVDRAEALTDEPVTLTVQITGNGNMKSVNEINFKAGEDFKVYDTVVSDISSGSKEFRILMIPLRPGEKTIEPARLCFFNPDKKIYSYARTQPISIKVEGEPSSGAEDTRNGLRGVSPVVKNDIHYNKQIKKPASYYKGYLIKNAVFWTVFTALFALFACMLFFSFHTVKKNRDPSVILKTEAEALSKKRIAAAEQEIARDKSRDFYENLYQGLAFSITARTGIRAENVSPQDIARELEKSGLDAQSSKKAKEILETINFYRFASVKPDEKSMRDILDEVKTAINILRKR